MSDITILQVGRDELVAMIERATRQALQAVTRDSGEVWRSGDVARHYNVSTRTIRTWEVEGKLPPKSGRYWRRADVLQWDRDRASAPG